MAALNAASRVEAVAGSSSTRRLGSWISARVKPLQVSERKPACAPLGVLNQTQPLDCGVDDGRSRAADRIDSTACVAHAIDTKWSAIEIRGPLPSDEGDKGGQVR